MMCHIRETFTLTLICYWRILILDLLYLSGIIQLMINKEHSIRTILGLFRVFSYQSRVIPLLDWLTFRRAFMIIIIDSRVETHKFMVPRCGFISIRHLPILWNYWVCTIWQNWDSYHVTFQVRRCYLTVSSVNCMFTFSTTQLREQVFEVDPLFILYLEVLIGTWHYWGVSWLNLLPFK